MDEGSIDFSDQSYFIFESKEKLFEDDIYIELIVTNVTPYDEDDIFEQTFRLIYLSSPGNSSKTWLTELYQSFIITEIALIRSREAEKNTFNFKNNFNSLNGIRVSSFSILIG